MIIFTKNWAFCKSKLECTCTVVESNLSETWSLKFSKVFIFVCFSDTALKSVVQKCKLAQLNHLTFTASAAPLICGEMRESICIPKRRRGNRIDCLFLTNGKSDGSKDMPKVSDDSNHRSTT